MLLWFLGTAVVTVWFVFRDPRFDYRLLLVGALLPDIVDVPFGVARFAHSLTVAVAVLAVVMLATSRRNPARRLLLALPIGMLLHLVWDGAFASAKVFWWPFSGGWGHVRVPSLARGWWDVVLELAGALMLWWAYRTFHLADPARRRDLVRAGRLTDGSTDDRDQATRR
jgi:hypothetical protein